MYLTIKNFRIWLAYDSTRTFISSPIFWELRYYEPRNSRPGFPCSGFKPGDWPGKDCVGSGFQEGFRSVRFSGRGAEVLLRGMNGGVGGGGGNGNKGGWRYFGGGGGLLEGFWASFDEI